MRARWLRHVATLPAVVVGAWYGSSTQSVERFSWRARERSPGSSGPRSRALSLGVDGAAPRARKPGLSGR